MTFTYCYYRAAVTSLDDAIRHPLRETSPSMLKLGAQSSEVILSTLFVLKRVLALRFIFRVIRLCFGPSENDTVYFRMVVDVT